MIKLVGPKDSGMYSSEKNFINTTSRSRDWGKGLSPFLLGPVKLYPGAPCVESKSFENAWQYAKVYSNHLDENGNPSDEYFKWAKIGFLTQRAERYPMGKGAKPEYSWWGEKLSYVEARKKIYIPLYAEAVKKTEAYNKLSVLHKNNEDIILWDFDVSYREPGTFNYLDLVNDSTITLGHAYVIAMCLEGLI